MQLSQTSFYPSRNRIFLALPALPGNIPEISNIIRRHFVKRWRMWLHKVGINVSNSYTHHFNHRHHSSLFPIMLSTVKHYSNTMPKYKPISKEMIMNDRDYNTTPNLSQTWHWYHNGNTDHNTSYVLWIRQWCLNWHISCDSRRLKPSKCERQSSPIYYWYYFWYI